MAKKIPQPTAPPRERAFLIGAHLKARTEWDVQDSLAAVTDERPHQTIPGMVARSIRPRGKMGKNGRRAGIGDRAHVSRDAGRR